MSHLYRLGSSGCASKKVSRSVLPRGHECLRDIRAYIQVIQMYRAGRKGYIGV